MANQIDFRLRYQVREDTPLGRLLKYLNSDDTEFPSRQMVMSALNAFWYPLACKWSGEVGEDRLQSIARYAIYELQQQIKYLARTFGLEQELIALEASYGMGATPEARPTAVEDQSVPESVQGGGGTETPMSPPSVEGPDLLNDYQDDDKILNQMFN